MTDKLSRSATSLVLVATIGFIYTTSAFAQQPTDEQRSAIRSSCRSDYQANCASVPPGGMASLQCLQKNMSKLSDACQRAVSAIEPAQALPKVEAAPAPSAPAAPVPVATKATTVPAPAAAPTSAASAPAVNSRPASAPKGTAQIPAVARAPSDVATSSPIAAPADTPIPPMVLRPMRPREELFVLRSACGGDAGAVCGGIAPGGGRIVQCLAANASALSSACKDILGQFVAQ